MSDENGVTNLDSLPIKQSIPNNEFVQPAAQQQQPVQSKQHPQEPTQMNQSEFVNGIQQAYSSGMLELPSRDIPQTQTHITTDNNIQTDYIPKPKVENTQYIPTEYNTNCENKNSDNYNYDNLYNELKIPVIVAFIYYMFQTQNIKKILLKSVPFCYNKLGDINISGHLLISSLFGILVYVVNLVLKTTN